VWDEEMIRDPQTVRIFGDSFIRTQGLSHRKALKIFEAMWLEGVRLGVLPLKEPLEGIETDITVARILNSCSKSFSPQ
jgi:hypothetical protein